MKSEKRILVAFLLNLGFSLFEFFGGVFTRSVAIFSDAIHDLGDSISIGASYFLEKKSNQQPDKKYNFGYARFSILGAVITTLILLIGSIMVAYSAIKRIIQPVAINYNGMIIFAVIGTIVNLFACVFTKGEHSINQKAVNLHMLEDVLGWLVVLIGAIVMKFTNLLILDPLMSLGVAVFIFINACKTAKEILDLFLIKTPKGIDIDELKACVADIDNVIDAHHIHVWSTDGKNIYATMHVVANGSTATIKEKIKLKLKEHGIIHSTLEFETIEENCNETTCQVENSHHTRTHHHHCH